MTVEQFEAPANRSHVEAFKKLETGDPSAMAAFAAHVGNNAHDALAGFHLKRLLNVASGTRIIIE